MRRDSDAASPGFRPWEALPAVFVVAVFALWAVPALLDVTPDDLRVLHAGGVLGWHTGHPERSAQWLSTSFLGLVMAMIATGLSLEATVVALNVLNLFLVVVGAALVWRGLRGRLAPVWWWATLGLALSYSPLLSTIRWKQLNLVVLALALGGFALLRRGHVFRGASLIAASLALKPLAVVLPLALVSRRDTRRAGLLCLAGVLALTALGQGFLAWRGRDASLLSPFPTAENFAARARGWQAAPENFSPYSLVHKLTRSSDPVQLGVLAAALALAVLLANESVRRLEGRSWEILAWALLLSTLVGPISWSHYQVLLLPMFVVLASRLAGEGAGFVWWSTLTFAFVLASLVQRPLPFSVPGALRLWFAGRPETWADEVRVMALSQLAPYFLFLAAFGWLGRNSYGAPSSRVSCGGTG